MSGNTQAAPPPHAPTEEEVRARVHLAVMRHVSAREERREEALRDYCGILMPDLDRNTVQKLAAMIPAVMPELYRRWADMFVESLMQTASPEHLAALCENTPEAQATVALVFVMFLESERMERQVARDLEDYGRKHSDEETGMAAAVFLKDRFARLLEEADGAAPPRADA